MTLVQGEADQGSEVVRGQHLGHHHIIQAVHCKKKWGVKSIRYGLQGYPTQYSLLSVLKKSRNLRTETLKLGPCSDEIIGFKDYNFLLKILVYEGVPKNILVFDRTKRVSGWD